MVVTNLLALPFPPKPTLENGFPPSGFPPGPLGPIAVVYGPIQLPNNDPWWRVLVHVACRPPRGVDGELPLKGIFIQ